MHVLFSYEHILAILTISFEQNIIMRHDYITNGPSGKSLIKSLMDRYFKGSQCYSLTCMFLNLGSGVMMLPSR